MFFGDNILYVVIIQTSYVAFNSLWRSDAIWPTLVRIMACCLTAPIYYLNQYQLIIRVVLWHSPEANFTGNAQDTYPWYEFDNYQFMIKPRPLGLIIHCSDVIWAEIASQSTSKTQLFVQQHLQADSKIIKFRRYWSFVKGMHGWPIPHTGSVKRKAFPYHEVTMYHFLVRFMITSSNGKIFRVTGILCGGFTGSRWIPRTKASDAELWCFLWSTPEYTVVQTIVRLVIWDAIAPIMTSP